MYTKLLARKT